MIAQPEHGQTPAHDAAAEQKTAPAHEAAPGHEGDPAGHELGAAGHSESPLEHIVQHPLIELPADLGPLTPNGMITLFSDQIAMIALAGVLLIALVPLLVKRRRGAGAVDAHGSSGAANVIEAICHYIRTEVAEPILHEYTDRFIKYIWSVFFFVLTVNILGLLPIPAVSSLFHLHLGGTATGNIWVTATLASTRW